jgi:hypothetical protein
MRSTSLRNDQRLAEEVTQSSMQLPPIHDTLQYLYGALHYAIDNVRTKDQAKTSPLVHFTEHPELLFVAWGIGSPASYGARETTRTRVAVNEKAHETTKVEVSIDNNDVEERRGRDGEHYSSEEIRRRLTRCSNRLRRRFECPEGHVPRQVEMLKRGLVFPNKFPASIRSLPSC